MNNKTIVRMCVVPETNKFYVVAFHPIHGEKWLIQVTKRQINSKGQQYRKEAERIFISRCGVGYDKLQFEWASVY